MPNGQEARRAFVMTKKHANASMLVRREALRFTPSVLHMMSTINLHSLLSLTICFGLLVIVTIPKFYYTVVNIMVDKGSNYFEN